MWCVMAHTQQTYHLSERLIRCITYWQNIPGQDDDVEELLESGADVNRIHGLLLPLHTACMVGDVDVVQLLIDHGANVSAIDGYHRSALHYASEQSVECVELLLLHGVDPDTPDINHDTALHWAAFKNKPQCVRALLRHGASVNVRDVNDDTPLSWAAMKGNLDSVTVLLQYNADVYTVNNGGQTPVTRAARLLTTGLNTYTDDQCLDLLLQAMGQFDVRSVHSPATLMADGNKLSDLLLPYCRNTRSLQHLCRYRIRTCLGEGLLTNTVQGLPLPQRLREFILLQR